MCPSTFFESIPTKYFSWVIWPTSMLTWPQCFVWLIRRIRTAKHHRTWAGNCAVRRHQPIKEWRCGRRRRRLDRTRTPTPLRWQIWLCCLLGHGAFLSDIWRRTMLSQIFYLHIIWAAYTIQNNAHVRRCSRKKWKWPTGLLKRSAWMRTQ